MQSAEAIEKKGVCIFEDAKKGRRVRKGMKGKDLMTGDWRLGDWVTGAS
jgi:hypothetical protein